VVIRFRGGSCLLAGFMALALANGPAGAQVTNTYTYDGVGRVLSAVDSSGAQVVYQYDAAGIAPRWQRRRGR